MLKRVSGKGFINEAEHRQEEPLGVVVWLSGLGVEALPATGLFVAGMLRAGAWFPYDDIWSLVNISEGEGEW